MNCEKTRTIGESEICPECGNTYILKSGSQKVCENCRKKHTNKMKSKSNAKYTAKNYDTCILYMKKGTKKNVQDFAAERNMSFNELVNQAITLYIQQNSNNKND